MTDLAFVDATAQAELVRSQQATPAELVDAAIDRIEHLNGELNAVIHPLFERARAEAAGDLPNGPFRGVPVLVKDHDGELADTPLHHGNAALRDAGHTASRTSYIFERLQQAGFVIVGKTNTPELGLLPTAEPVAYGPTRNPWNLAHSCGGSSGGSGAAVAAGLVPVGHAGDGGGSIRIPASMCGLFGLKPNRGRVSLGPMEGEAWGGLVQRHVLTRTVRDSAAVLDILEGAEPGDPYTAPPPARAYRDEVGADPGTLRIGLRTDASGGLAETDPTCAEAARHLAHVLESLGHTVEEACPAAFDDAETVFTGFTAIMSSFVLADVEALGRDVGRELGPDDVEPYTWAQAELGRSVTGGDYLAALESLRAWARQMASFWADDGFDLLVTPTMAALPPRIGTIDPANEDAAVTLMQATPYGVMTVPFNITGQPAMSVPAEWTGEGLPVGVQLVAAQYREDLLLRVASQLESELAWAERVPPVHA